MPTGFNLNQATPIMVTIIYLFLMVDFLYISRRPGTPAACRYNKTAAFGNIAVVTMDFAAVSLVTRHVDRLYAWIKPFSLSLLHIGPKSILGIVGLFLWVDFMFYVWHRLSHNYRLIWIGHQAHHQDTHFNALTGRRMGFLEYVTMIPAFSLSILAGAPIGSLLVTTRLSLQIMSFYHSSIGKLPRWIENIFNTPSNHRKHHESGPMAGRCNYGAFLVIWDQIFGTYQPETEMVTNFGVQGVANDFRPLAHQLIGLVPGMKSFSSGRSMSDLFTFRGQAVIFLFLTLTVLPLHRGSSLSAILSLMLLGSLEFYDRIKPRWRPLFWCFVIFSIVELFVDSLAVLRYGRDVAGWRLWVAFAATFLPNLIAILSSDDSPPGSLGKPAAQVPAVGA